MSHPACRPLVARNASSRVAVDSLWRFSAVSVLGYVLKIYLAILASPVLKHETPRAYVQHLFYGRGRLDLIEYCKLG